MSTAKKKTRLVRIVEQEEQTRSISWDEALQEFLLLKKAINEVISYWRSLTVKRVTYNRLTQVQLLAPIPDDPATLLNNAY